MMLETTLREAELQHNVSSNGIDQEFYFDEYKEEDILGARCIP